MAKEKLRLIEKLPGDLYRRLTEEIYDGVYFLNVDKKIIFWNKEAAKITGYPAKYMIGRYCFMTPFRHMGKNGVELCHTGKCPVSYTLKSNLPCARRVYIKRRDRQTIPIDIHTASIKREGAIIGVVKVFRDASLYERIARQREKEKKRAFTDPLTLLPNRRAISKRLNIELMRFERYGADSHVSIIDVDRFKRINDTYGHEAGDTALKKLAAILRYRLRTTDYIGRSGGDEFIIIFPNDVKRNTLTALERVRELAEETKLSKTGINISVSIGFTAIKPKDTEGAVLKRADRALYKAKKRGRNKIVFVK